jgi:4-amino-4-deoxy-L-arabinose transferase-like glycosyltransferase
VTLSIRPSRAVVVGLALTAIAFVVYWLCDRDFDAGRGDFFYLADAFLHGRTYLDAQSGVNDVIIIDNRFYVPFAPFPAIAFMPLGAFIGALTADQIESGINAALAATCVGLCWWLVGRIGVARLRDRFWLTLLLGFSTQILWVTTRGGVWHTGHLIATILTLGCLIELWGQRRAWLIGLLAGAAFLTRAPLAFALPFYALLLVPLPLRRGRGLPWREWAGLAVGAAPSFAFFFVYNQARFGSPFESGYALATLPSWLEDQRRQGLFALVHVPMNLDYLFYHLPKPIPDPPFFKPDGLGLSVFITSPGLLYAIRADWRRGPSWLLLGAAVAVLIPTLLYYGGGWLQYGYRYFLDSIPFVLTLCALAAARRGPIGLGWRILILAGVGVMFIGVYWAYHLF